jgi:hypothetical protein
VRRLVEGAHHVDAGQVGAVAVEKNGPGSPRSATRMPRLNGPGSAARWPAAPRG